MQLFKEIKNNVQGLKYVSEHQKIFLRNTGIAIIVWVFIGDSLILNNFFTQVVSHFSFWTIGFISDKTPEIYYHTDKLGLVSGNVNDFRGRVCIGSPCNGMDLYYLCLSFIWVFPTISKKRKVLYGINGVGVIFVANVLRIAALFELLENHPDWFDLFHKTIFQFIIYLLLFILWGFYLKDTRKKVEPSV
jgi:exosortase/archaeosortase family protein